MLSVAGAVFGAEIVGVFEAVRMSDQAHVPFGDLASGDAAVLVPLATVLGLLVAAAAMALGLGPTGRIAAALRRAGRPPWGGNTRWWPYLVHHVAYPHVPQWDPGR